MFNNWYSDIGGKIKRWAKWIFIVESICAIIAGICIILNALSYADESNAVWGILLIIFGPPVAFVSTWILYAFGQLVEDVHAMRDEEGTTQEVNARREAEEKVEQEANKSHICKCGERFYGDTCTICGRTLWDLYL